MSFFAPFTKSSILKTAVNQVNKARKSQGNTAEQLYKSAYEGFSKVVAGDLNTAEALHNWGFALLHEAKTKQPMEAKALYLEAIDKFTFCLLVAPNHLGGSIDGGVAYMEMARLDNASPDHAYYEKAFGFFTKAEQIQKGSASYNIACIHALREEKDNCLKSLEQARESGSLPGEQEIMNDPDLRSIRNLQWFHEFLGSVAVSLAEQQENERRTRRGLKKAEEVKLDMPPRPTDSTLRRHFDAMMAAELEHQRELQVQKKREAEEQARKKKGDQFNYYK